MYQLWVSQVTGKMRNCGSKNSFSCLNLSDRKSGTINGMINDTEKSVYKRIVASPGISAVALANEFGRSIITIKRALKHLTELNVIEYRGSKKTGGYFSR